MFIPIKAIAVKKESTRQSPQTADVVFTSILTKADPEVEGDEDSISDKVSLSEKGFNTLMLKENSLMHIFDGGKVTFFVVDNDKGEYLKLNGKSKTGNKGRKFSPKVLAEHLAEAGLIEKVRADKYSQAFKLVAVEDAPKSINDLIGIANKQAEEKNASLAEGETPSPVYPVMADKDNFALKAAFTLEQTDATAEDVEEVEEKVETPTSVADAPVATDATTPEEPTDAQITEPDAVVTQEDSENDW